MIKVDAGDAQRRQRPLFAPLRQFLWHIRLAISLTEGEPAGTINEATNVPWQLFGHLVRCLFAPRFLVLDDHGHAQDQGFLSLADRAPQLLPSHEGRDRPERNLSPEALPTGQELVAD